MKQERAVLIASTSTKATSDVPWKPRGESVLLGISGVEYRQLTAALEASNALFSLDLWGFP
jgi:hypothetical protein